MTDARQQDEDTRRKLVRNKRIEASASLLNSIANTTIATGAIGAVAAFLYGITTPKSPYWFLFAACWAVIGVLMHAIARWTLGGLKP